MSGYVKTFKNKDGDKDKNKNNKLMFFHGADDKLLKNIIIWTQTENLQNIELNAAPVYDNRYDDKTKTRTYGDKIYTNFCS